MARRTKAKLVGGRITADEARNQSKQANERKDRERLEDAKMFEQDIEDSTKEYLDVIDLVIEEAIENGVSFCQCQYSDHSLFALIKEDQMDRRVIDNITHSLDARKFRYHDFPDQCPGEMRGITLSW